ncbi:hypothetical protein MYK68_01020 [Gordonia sp. PP30]|uniref:hypothetical protein n=1 Tax=Gordonia sp. PP30 TaxID=2935861 RepID=UPI001FFFC36D|nr:hypothetical protein [Gordonia sp. PP30]UQE75253.1 hypothetical protein MYK68_01020 [Gordonia sp. PP30]
MAWIRGGHAVIAAVGAVGWWMYLVGAVVSCGVWRIGETFASGVTDDGWAAYIPGPARYTSDPQTIADYQMAFTRDNDVNAIRVVALVGLIAVVGAAVALIVRRRSSQAVVALATLVVSFLLVELAANGFDEVDLRPALTFVVLLVAVALREFTWRRATAPVAQPQVG